VRGLVFRRNTAATGGRSARKVSRGQGWVSRGSHIGLGVSCRFFPPPGPPQDGGRLDDASVVDNDASDEVGSDDAVEGHSSSCRWRQAIDGQSSRSFSKHSLPSLKDPTCLFTTGMSLSERRT
jgi:hypothetical protein